MQRIDLSSSRASCESSHRNLHKIQSATTQDEDPTHSQYALQQHKMKDQPFFRPEITALAIERDQIRQLMRLPNRQRQIQHVFSHGITKYLNHKTNKIIKSQPTCLEQSDWSTILIKDLMSYNSSIKAIQMKSVYDTIINSSSFSSNKVLFTKCETYSFFSLKFFSPGIDCIGIVDSYTYNRINSFPLEAVDISVVARDMLCRTHSSVCSLRA